MTTTTKARKKKSKNDISLVGVYEDRDDGPADDAESLATESTENTEGPEAIKTDSSLPPPPSETSVDSVAKPPADQAAAPSPAEAHLDKIKAARAVVADRERIYLSRKSQAKQAKEAFEEAVADLTAVIDDGEEYLPLFDGRPEAVGCRPEAAGREIQSPASSLQSPAENNAWRQASIDELRLSPKIAEKLCEAGCETIGALEDLRASHKGLRSIGGIGQKKIDIIEDAILKWLTENRDREVFERQAGGERPEAGDNAELQSSASSLQPAIDSEHARQVHARAVELDNGEQSLQQQEPMRPWWADGKRAYEEGEPLESCLWTAGKEQDDWIRGWLHAAPVEKSTADKLAAAH